MSTYSTFLRNIHICIRLFGIQTTTYFNENAFPNYNDDMTNSVLCITAIKIYVYTYYYYGQARIQQGRGGRRFCSSAAEFLRNVCRKQRDERGPTPYFISKISNGLVKSRYPWLVLFNQKYNNNVQYLRTTSVSVKEHVRRFSIVTETFYKKPRKVD